MPPYVGSYNINNLFIIISHSSGCQLVSDSRFFGLVLGFFRGLQSYSGWGVIIWRMFIHTSSDNLEILKLLWSWNNWDSKEPLCNVSTTWNVAQGSKVSGQREREGKKVNEKERDKECIAFSIRALKVKLHRYCCILCAETM